VLGDAIEKMTAKAEAKKIRLLLSHREAPVFASICPAGLREVLVRLLDNAIKFSAIGDVVEIEIEVDENILVRIRDHGIGIESSALARLGKPFVQVESHLHRSHGGIGLGLAISYGLARLMGCRIAIESELGVGSTVTIRLESNPAAVLQNQAA